MNCFQRSRKGKIFIAHLKTTHNTIFVCTCSLTRAYRYPTCNDTIKTAPQGKHAALGIKTCTHKTHSGIYLLSAQPCFAGFKCSAGFGFSFVCFLHRNSLRSFPTIQFKNILRGTHIGPSKAHWQDHILGHPQCTSLHSDTCSLLVGVKSHHPHSQH